MLIFSTFTADYLKSPLHYLLEKFYEKTIDLRYTDTNLLIWINRCFSEEINEPIVILFRLIDLKNFNNDTESIYLEENLNKLIESTTKLKKNKKQTVIVVLCPSPEDFYNEKIKSL